MSTPNNLENLISGKSSSLSNEDKLVIDLDKGSSEYEASGSSLETSFDSEMERLLLQTTQAAMPREVQPADCELTRIAKEQRKVGFFPINPTSENLRKACTVDRDGDYVWKEDPRDQILCPHCGYILHEHDRQVVNFPCWHRSHMECQRNFKCLNWDKMILVCPYKVCRFPIVDDGDDLFNKEQLFFCEMAPWRTMVTFRQLMTLSHERVRDLEAYLHNHRIRFGWKWDPTYLVHYRQPIQNRIRDIIIKDEYNQDLPMSLNGVKDRVNRRRFRNGTEFVYFASNDFEKLPKNTWEMDFTELVDIGFFGDYEQSRETRERVQMKIGKALLGGAQAVDFKTEFGIEVEFQSRRGWVKNFGLDGRGHYQPLDFDHDDEDENEGRLDGRSRYRPPSQNNFHLGDSAAMDAQNDEPVPQENGDELLEDELMEIRKGEDILDKLLQMKEPKLEKVLAAWQADLESSIERIEANLDDMAEAPEEKATSPQEKATSPQEKVMAAKERSTQTFLKGVKDRGVQATDLEYDQRDTIINFFVYDFTHKLTRAERGYYNPEEIKFILKYTDSIPALKELIFGFMDEPIVLVPRLRNVEFDLELEAMSGFKIVHTGSLQFLSDVDLPINPKVHQKEQIYYGDPSSNLYFDYTDFSSDMAVAGSSNEASIVSSPSSFENSALVQTGNKVKRSRISIFKSFFLVSKKFVCSGLGPSSTISSPRQTQLDVAYVLRTHSSFKLRPSLSNWHWMTQDFWQMARRTFQLCMTKTVLKTSRRKRSFWKRNSFKAKSPLKANFRIFRQIIVCRFHEIFFSLRKLIFLKNHSSILIRVTDFAREIYLVKEYLFNLVFSVQLLSNVNSFHEIFSSSNTTLTYFFLPTSFLTIVDLPPKNAQILSFVVVVQPTQIQTGYPFENYDHYTYTLHFEIKPVNCHHSSAQHSFFLAMEAKKIAIFSVKGRNNTEFKAELCDKDIVFPPLNLESWDSKMGRIFEKYIEVHLKFFVKISVLRLEKADFRRLVLPQMVLFHITTGLIEGFMRSMFRGVEREQGMLREVHWHQKGGQGQDRPKFLAKNGKLTVQLINPPSMKKLQVTMAKTCNYLSFFMSHTRFQFRLLPYQMHMIICYLHDSDELRTLLQEKAKYLLNGSPGNVFVTQILKHLDDCDMGFYHYYYHNIDQFDKYFAYGSIDDWHLKRIDVTNLLEQAKKNVPDIRKEIFGLASGGEFIW